MLKSAAGVDVSSASVAVDGTVPPTPLDGTAISVDPGEHTFTFSVGGRPPVVLHLFLHEGERLQREVAFASVKALDDRERPSVRSNTMRLVGWSALGAGFAG